jgi:hypothetical protein
MNTVLRIGVLVLFALVVFGSAWYVAFRLRTTFGLRRRWLLRVLVMAALIGSFMSMGLATKSADVAAGLSYVLGGYLFAGYVFLTLAFVLLHVIERVWHIPRARVRRRCFWRPARRSSAACGPIGSRLWRPRLHSPAWTARS